MLLSIVILSFNRRAALLRTLREVAASITGCGGESACEIIVVDNASTDGTVEALRAAEYAGITVVALSSNVGVDGFNQGVARAAGEFVLVLDDDAWPAAGVLASVLAYVQEHPSIAGAALVPTHPASGASEWPFAAARSVAFPVFGCGNVVRTSAWRAVGGYEKDFFLYRNDADLAMKLLGAGHGVAFDPAWVVYHDSNAAGPKSDRWLELATRNWVWMCKRHGSRVGACVAGILGTAWALRHAGMSLQRNTLVLRGAWQGVRQPAPRVPESVKPDGTALWRLVRMHVQGVGSRR